MSRLSRKEMKRDEVLETVGTVFDYIRDNTRSILWGLAAVLVLTLLAVGFFVHQGRRQSQGAESLAAALQVYGAVVDSAAPNPDDPRSPVFADDTARRVRARELFERVRNEHGGTDAADLAEAYLGQLDAVEEDLAAARARWEGFLESQPDHLLAAEIRVNLMALDRAEGRSEELVDDLRARLDDPRESLPAEMLLNQLGITLEELDRREEAREVYGRLVQEYPQSPYFGRAQRQFEALQGG